MYPKGYQLEWKFQCLQPISVLLRLSSQKIADFGLFDGWKWEFFHLWHILWPIGGVWQHVSDEKKKKKFHPGTQFEAGSFDPKMHALPTELQNEGIFGQKITSAYFKRFDFVLQKKRAFHISLIW